LAKINIIALVLVTGHPVYPGSTVLALFQLSTSENIGFHIIFDLKIDLSFFFKVWIPNPCSVLSSSKAYVKKVIISHIIKNFIY